MFNGLQSKTMGFLKLIMDSNIYQTFFIKKLATSATWIIILTVIIINLNLNHWNNPNKIIGADVKSYYLYLPAIFIYHDISLGFITNNQHKLDGKTW
jgi:hypothetical protein